MRRAPERGRVYAGLLILEFVLEREPGSGSIQFSAYGYIAPTRRLACVSSMTCAHARSKGYNNLYYPFDKFCDIYAVRGAEIL